MLEFTRRRFLAQASLGVGATVVSVGVASAAPTLAQPAPAAPVQPSLPDSALPSLSTPLGATLSEPAIVHVRDVATAEVALYMGEQDRVPRPRPGDAARMGGPPGSGRGGISDVVPS